MRTIRSRTSQISGFTLVEMAIVLAIMALILGTGLTLLSTQQDQGRIEATKALLSDANEALIGYTLASAAVDFRPYLPCPDVLPGVVVSLPNVANDGLEDRITIPGPCVTQEGNLPWVTLGLTPAIDPWSDRLRYRVTDHFSNSTTGMLLTSSGDIDVKDAAAGNILASNVPAVILSHGKNGLGAINAAGYANPAPPATNIDERVNIDANTTFVSHSLTSVNETGGYFDDQVIWLSQYTLYNRLVQAGKLP